MLLLDACPCWCSFHCACGTELILDFYLYLTCTSLSVAIFVVIVRRVRQFVVGMKSRRLGKISAYEVSLSVIAILKFAGLPAG